jgi:hypothetical protein
MRVTVFLAAAALALASGSAIACPMQTAAQNQGQTVASSGGNSTPIPAKTQQGNNG